MSWKKKNILINIFMKDYDGNIPEIRNKIKTNLNNSLIYIK